MSFGSGAGKRIKKIKAYWRLSQIRWRFFKLKILRIFSAFRSPRIAEGFYPVEAVELTQKHEFTTFPVVDKKHRCVGSVTEMRLRRTLVKNNDKKSFAKLPINATRYIRIIF
jgi:CBS-domain-containing membrane protein